MEVGRKDRNLVSCVWYSLAKCGLKFPTSEGLGVKPQTKMLRFVIKCGTASGCIFSHFMWGSTYPELLASDRQLVPSLPLGEHWTHMPSGNQIGVKTDLTHGPRCKYASNIQHVRPQTAYGPVNLGFQRNKAIGSGVDGPLALTGDMRICDVTL